MIYVRVLRTGSLYRVCQDPVGGVVLGVIDEAVLNESQIDAFDFKKGRKRHKIKAPLLCVSYLIFDFDTEGLHTFINNLYTVL